MVLWRVSKVRSDAAASEIATAQRSTMNLLENISSALSRYASLYSCRRVCTLHIDDVTLCRPRRPALPAKMNVVKKVVGM